MESNEDYFLFTQFNTLFDTPDSGDMLKQIHTSQGVKPISAHISSHLKHFQNKTWTFKPVSSSFGLNVGHCGWKNMLQ